MSTAIISVTAHGAQIGQALRAAYGPSEVTCWEKENRQSGGDAQYFTSMKDEISSWWKSYDRILFIMATGIVVRMIAPYIEHKSKDPAILVMDEQATFCISLLSGHLGGANEWTREVATMTGATPVITTATDVNDIPAPDVLARKLHLTVEDFTELIHVNAALVAKEEVIYYVDKDLGEDYQKAVADHKVKYEVLPMGIPSSSSEALITEEGNTSTVAISQDIAVLQRSAPKVVITDKLITVGPNTLILRPKTMTMGIGCRRDTPKEMILHAIDDSLKNLGRSPKSVLSAASVIVKADEVGLLEAIAEKHWPIHFYKQEEMAKVIDTLHITESNFVKNTIGVGNVCETTALLRAKSQTLLQTKTIYPRVTVAIAQVPLQLSALDQVIKNI